MEFVRTKTLSIAVEIAGSDDGWPVVLFHGFPYDPRSYDEVVPLLVAQGARVFVPYLRGFGPTTFLDAESIRTGQQAAIGMDAVALIDTLTLESPILVGFDWGGRAACVAAAAWPAGVGGLVAIGGYEIQDIAAAAVTPDLPSEESKAWYQYYFHSARGVAGLTEYRRELTKQLWQEWAPGRSTDGFALTAPSFDNPDFVDVVIHSYRHRLGLADGDPVYDAIEAGLAASPVITVPTIVLDPTEDPMIEPQSIEAHRKHFSNLIDHRLVAAGHDLPRHAPAAVADAVLALHQLSLARDSE